MPEIIDTHSEAEAWERHKKSDRIRANIDDSGADAVIWKPREEIEEIYWNTHIVSNAVHEVLMGMTSWEISTIRNHVQKRKRKIESAWNTDLVEKNQVLLSELDKVDPDCGVRVRKAILRSPLGTGVHIERKWWKDDSPIIYIKLQYPTSERHPKWKIKIIRRVP
jgi:hypothetical protein